VIADGKLAALYATALRRFGAETRIIASTDAFVAGAALIAQRVAWG